MLLPKITEAQFGELHEAVRGFYAKQADGTYLLQVQSQDGLALENVGGLKTTLGKLKTKIETLETQNAAFEGIDPQKAKDAIAKVGEMANWSPNEKVTEQVNAYKQQVESKHKSEIEKLTGEIQEEQAVNSKLMIDQTAMQELATAGARNESLAALLYPFHNKCRVRRMESGKRIVEILDENNNVRISPAAGSTDPMSIAEMVAEVKISPAYSPLFDGSGASGSGASGSAAGRRTGAGGGRMGMSEEDILKLPPAQRMQAAQAAGINT